VGRGRALSTAHDLAQALGGKRAQRLADGGYLVPCPVPTHGKGRGDRTPSLSISDGQKRLLVRCFAGCNSRDVLDELLRRGLLDDRTRPPAVANKPTEQRASDSPDKYQQCQHEKASWLWSQRRPITGTIAETYLRKRNITGPLPTTLGFLPAKGDYAPAMIAAFVIPDEPEPGVVGVPRDVRSVHVTRLLPDGSDREHGERAKIIIGSPLGRPIVLAPPNDLLALAITEGIEDALTVHAALGMGAWAAASAGFMPALAEKVPDYIDAVTVFAHADTAGQNGAIELAKRLHGRGIEVFIEGIAS
jgi:hypothetical protein